jgi:carboxymethylenebutenolidase
VRSVVDRLADRGFVALAPELFHRTGTHVEVPYTERPRVLAMLESVTSAALEEDAGAALAALRARSEVDPQRLGVVGFCLGGFAAILTGLTNAVHSVVAFYPGLMIRPRPNFQIAPIIDRVPELRVPTLVQIGANDQGIPAADVETIRAALARSSARNEVIVYPDADHGFHSHDHEPTYHPAVAERAWHMTLHWFAETLW